jgi:nitric oxide reductase subunit B
LKNGYWHARGPEFLNARITTLIEWMRLPADAVFILLGVVPLLISAGLTYRFVRR